MRSPVKPALRIAILARDGFTCQYCGRFAPNVILHVDHITPVSGGGLDDATNLITACRRCNLGKGAKHLDHLAVGIQRPKDAQKEEPNYQFEVLAPADDSEPASLRVTSRRGPPGRWVDVTKLEMWRAGSDDLQLLELYAAKGGFSDELLDFMIQYDLTEEDMAVLECAAAVQLQAEFGQKDDDANVEPLSEGEQLQIIVERLGD